MKKKKIVCLALCVSLLLFAGSLSVFSADTAPGSSSDPVVTKSYVDSVSAELKSLISSLEAKIGGGSASQSGSASQGGDTESQGGGVSSGASFVVVEVAQGGKLLGAEGTEMILRSGSATIIDNAGGDGIADLTDGSNLNGGASLAKNHHILVPREDGRGIACSSDCYVMVKGGYTIQ